jgi:hypothetical protein
MMTRARFALTIAAMSVASAGAAQETPEQTVSILVGAPHGLTWASGPEVTRRVTQVQQNPGPYIPLLLQRLDPARVTETDERRRQAENAATVLVQAGGEAGRSQLAARVADLQAAGDRESTRLADRARALGAPRAPELVEGSRRVDRLRAVERAVVAAFASAKDARLRDAVLARLPSADRAIQLSYLDYLGAAAPNDPVVRQRLTALFDDRQSSLYQSPKVGALIGRTPPR